MQPFVRASRLGAAAAGVLAAGALLTAQQQGTYTQADISFGAGVYAGQCAGCHAPTGDGIAGVNLSSGKFRNATTDRELSLLLTTGVKTMPAQKLNNAEVLGVVAYLRNMSSINAKGLKIGDPARGETLVTGKGGCLACHMIRDSGSRMAPSLSDIGSRRSAGYLERHLVAPDAQMFPINRPVHAVTREGKVIEGRRLNESSFSVQLIDTDGNLVSLLKSDLREYTIDNRSPMPSFQEKLTADEITDVLSYLLSLKGQ
jgi:putative heme-binding domain-containing protein